MTEPTKRATRGYCVVTPDRTSWYRGDAISGTFGPVEECTIFGTQFQAMLAAKDAAQGRILHVVPLVFDTATWCPVAPDAVLPTPEWVHNPYNRECRCDDCRVQGVRK